MSGEWAAVPLGEVITLQRGFDLPAQDRKLGKVPIVSSSGVSDYHSAVGVNGPGVVTGRCGTIGKVFLIKEDYWPLNTTLWVKDFHGNDPTFTSYLLRTVDFRSCSDKSSVPGVNRNDLHRIPVLRPPLAEQKAIAAVLGALDDKIELNRRMNATLEAMARALFQSWFVDFDPVRAKLDGRQPAGLDPATAALFPSALQKLPIGQTPKGWEVGRLDDVLVLQRGFDLPTPDRTNGKYPVMAASGLNGCHDKFMVRGPGVTTGRSGVLGKVFFVHGDFWPLNTSLWVKEFKCVSPAYAFQLIRGLDFEAFNAGSAVPTLNRNHVHNLPVVIPPKEIIDAFDLQVMPWMEKQKENENQSRTLAALRDSLIPKLLTGELSVGQLSVGSRRAHERTR